MNIFLGIFLLLFFLWLLFALAGSGTQNYCRCIREPRADDDDLYPECKENNK